MYKVVAGENYESVASKFGVGVVELKNANPQITKLKEGLVITIPSKQLKTTPVLETELCIYINETKIENFTSFRLTDALFEVGDQCSFVLPNEEEIRRLTKNNGLERVKITYNKEVVFKGRIAGRVFNKSEKGNSIRLSALSDVGFLTQTQFNTSVFPLEFTNLSFENLCKKISSGYCQVKNEAPLVNIKKASANFQETKASFLIRLAKQYNLYLNSTAEGELRIWNKKSNEVALNLKEGDMYTLSKIEKTLTTNINVFQEITEEQSEDFKNKMVYNVDLLLTKNYYSESLDCIDNLVLDAKNRNTTLILEYDKWIVENNLIKSGKCVNIKDSVQQVEGLFYIKKLTYITKESEKIIMELCEL